MIASLFATIASAQVEKLPDSVDALQKRMAVDSRKIANYRDAWIMTTTAPGGKVEVRVVRSIDRERFAMMALINGNPIVNLGSDGTSSYFALHANAVVSYYKTGNPWFTKLPTVDATKLADGDFNINLEGGYDWVVRCKPELKLISIQDALFEGEPAHLATGEAKRAGSEGRVLLKLWFPKNNFVLCRAEAIVTSETKQKFTFTAVRERVDRAAKFDVNEFKLPTGAAPNYKELPWATLVPGFQN